MGGLVLISNEWEETLTRLTVNVLTITRTVNWLRTNVWLDTQIGPVVVLAMRGMARGIEVIRTCILVMEGVVDIKKHAVMVWLHGSCGGYRMNKGLHWSPGGCHEEPGGLL